MRNLFVLCCFVLGLATMLTFSTDAYAVEIAGVVESCKGTADDFALSRAGKMLPINLLMPVMEGDEIIVYPDGSFLTIAYPDGSKEQVTKPKSPFRITVHGRPVRLSDKLLSLLGWVREKQERAIRPAGARNDEASGPFRWVVPGLSDGSASVVRGERRLGLAWSGGAGGYHVTVTAPSSETLLDVQVAATEVLTHEPRKLAPGLHQVLIVDAEGQQLEGSFKVVTPSALPAADATLPLWLGQGAVRTMHARNLAGKGGRTWCYEAYLSLIGVETDFGIDGEAALPKRLRREICDWKR